ncbi:TIM-barrel domain-containing protein [Amycolatopsis sp.]|uniref:TIM-barrel domain-containing protein n=1 Tax=Amycolatopsis sp. TaxID=37632 RepID=UPI0039C8B81D
MANARAFHESIRAEGDDEVVVVVVLCRSAWAGSQRYGAALWSGDIAATWDSLRAPGRGPQRRAVRDSVANPPTSEVSTAVTRNRRPTGN